LKVSCIFSMKFHSYNSSLMFVGIHICKKLCIFVYC
jgi:hypothetical protein